jgi:hypothetical protein
MFRFTTYVLRLTAVLQGLAARSVQRVWNTGDGRLKFMVIRDKECETE